MNKPNTEGATHEDKGHEKLNHYVVVVNGTETVVIINENAPLKALAEKALEQTGNIGRPLEDWRLKWNNQVLDLNKKIKEYDFPDDVVLFLSLIAGKGGSNA